MNELNEELRHIAENLYEGFNRGPYHDPEAENVVSALNHIGDGLHSIARAFDDYNALVARRDGVSI